MPFEGILVSIVKPRPSGEPDVNCEPATTQKDGSFEIKTLNCIKNFMLQIADPKSRFWPVFYAPAKFSPYPLDLHDIKVTSVGAQLSAEGQKDVIQILTNLRGTNPQVAALMDSTLRKQKGMDWRRHNSPIEVAKNPSTNLQPISISAEDAAGLLVKKTPPSYPAIARAARVKRVNCASGYHFQARGRSRTCAW